MERVLLLSMCFGTGHNATAAVLKEQFLQLPDVEAEMLDLLELAPHAFNPLLQSGYHGMLSKFPSLYHYLYDWTNQSRVVRYLSRELIEKIGRVIRKKLQERLNRIQPTRIVTTHPFGLILCPSRWMEIPTVSVVTDYEPHPVWFARVPHVLCLSKKILMKHQLDRIQWQTGMKLCETGIPVREEFYQQVGMKEAKKRLALDDRPVVLMMGGGKGLGPLELLVDQIRDKDGIQFVVLTGKNTFLYQRLKQNDYGSHIRIEGFREDVPLWMSAADLLVTKPGGVTVTEAIAKGLPMFLFEAFPGQEEANQQYLVHHRVAVVTHPVTIRAQIEKFFSAHYKRLFIQQRFDALRSRDAAERIVEETLGIHGPQAQTL